MRLQWTQDLDIETLEARGHWVKMEELLEVVTFHLPCYENTVKRWKTHPGQLNPSDLTFITKFLAMFVFIKVKGSHRRNGRCSKGKLAGKFGFNSLILTETSMQVLNGYIDFVRPLLKPQCDFVLVTGNGGQHSKLGDVMSKSICDAIGKFVHPKRYYHY